VPVQVTGRVAQIGPWFARSRMLVVPLRIGGGTRLKILEAMAHGLPVVTTSLGCAGLDVEHGRDIVVADDHAEFARWVDRLLGDDALACRIGMGGRCTVQRHYDWSTIGNALEAALAALPQPRRPASQVRRSSSGASPGPTSA
jgi:glycosyltransferase involved in cell wall biosynthesis